MAGDDLVLGLDRVIVGIGAVSVTDSGGESESEPLKSYSGLCGIGGGFDLTFGWDIEWDPLGSETDTGAVDGMAIGSVMEK